MTRRILVAVDGSKVAAGAANFAAQLAKENWMELILLHVLEEEKAVQELEENVGAQRLPDPARAQA